MDNNSIARHREPVGADGTSGADVSFDTVMRSLLSQRGRLAAELEATDRLIASLVGLRDQIEGRLRYANFPQRLSIAKAARYLGVGRNTIRRLLDQGALPAVQYSDTSDRVAIRRVDMDAFIANLPERKRRRVESRHGWPEVPPSSPG